MGERINEILKKLKPKEKIAIIASMSALAAILLGLVLLLAFCGADKHKHSYICTLELVDGKFTYTRSCTVKECGQPYYEDKDAKATVESVKDPTCGIKGEIVYVYSYQGSEARCIEYTPSTGKHTLNGKPVEEHLNQDGSINFGIAGVGLASGESTDRPCGTVVKGHYKCDGCGQLAQIDVAFGHREENKVIEEATCLEAGKQQLVCRDCGEKLANPTEIAPVGHKYDFELKQTNLVGECRYCSDDFKADVSTLQVVDETKATCAKAATITYKVKTGDGKTIEATVEIPGERPNHTLNGVDYTTLATPEGTYDITIPGINVSANKNACVLPKNGETNGSFVCEVCGELKNVHITPTDHEMEPDYSTIVYPTLTSSGKTTLRCFHKNCNEQIPLEVLPAVVIGTNAEVISENTVNQTVTVKYIYRPQLSSKAVELTLTLSTKHEHNYTYQLDETKTILTGVCDVLGCPNPNYRAEGITNLTKKSEIPATCASGKIVEYVCTANGKEVTFTVVEGEPNGEHVLNGKIAEPTEVVQVGNEIVKAYRYGTDGIVLAAGTKVEAGATFQAGFWCEECGELVRVWVHVPADYQP